MASVCGLAALHKLFPINQTEGWGDSKSFRETATVQKLDEVVDVKVTLEERLDAYFSDAELHSDLFLSSRPQESIILLRGG